MALPSVKRLSQSLIVRHGLLITGTTLLSLALLEFLFYQSIISRFEQRIESGLAERHALAHDLFRSEGTEALADFVRIREQIPAKQDLAFANFDSNGKRVYGNVAGITCNSGDFFDVLLDTSDPYPGSVALAVEQDSVSTANQVNNGDFERFRFLGADRGNECLVFGRSLQELDTLTARMRSMMIWTLPIGLLPTLVIGFVASRRLFARVERMSGAITRISQGQFGERLKVQGDDEIDRLSSKANSAFDKLEESVDALKQLSSMVAHDLKAPLSRLSMSLEEACRSADKGENNRLELEKVEANVVEMTETFDALLRIAQIESGRRRSSFQSLDLVSLARDMCEIYDPVCADAGMSLVQTPNLHQESLFIDGDRELLQQLLANLIGNSLRYCPPGSTLSLATTASDDHVQLSFYDDGPGIPEEERTKVFRRLYRVENTKKSGSGLGLSLVKAVAELHDATVSMHDAVPGLEVRILIPKASA